jgi:AcrR family transcriptional regulator
MVTRGRAPSEGAAPDELSATPNGLGSSLNGLGGVRVSEIQRARMLAGLVEVVGEHGAANVTVAHVVACSGVSRRTFYEMFVDREDCFLAAFDDAVRRIAAVVVPAYGESSRWRERIRAGLIALLGFLEYERGVGRLVIVDALGAGPVALERRRRVLAQVITAVEEGRGEVKRGDGPPPVTGEGIVGGVLAVLHSRLLEGPEASLLELTGPLMSMIVLPYLGGPAARKELQRTVPERRVGRPVGSADPLRDLEMRLTYRTVRVLMAVAEHPGSSNRQVGLYAGMQDQGQTSKLLSRLHRLALIENTGVGPSKGSPNAWTLTPKGAEVQQAISLQSTWQPTC